VSEVAHNFAERLAALNPAGTLVAAVSGGLDSMALLELLAENRRNVVVAHFNHQLRGAESDGDEAFVREEARKRDLIFRAGRGDVRAAAKGVSIEMAARRLRHEFLATVAREFNADLVLAHHADDQIELFLMRLLRGIEGAGLGGMNAVSPSPSDSSVRILRPFLDCSRADLEKFVKQRKISFREDSTNAELKADRNRIRHLVIPALREEAGVDFQKILLRHIGSIREQNEIARTAAKAWLAKPREFSELPKWLRREIVAMQLEQNAIPVTGERVAKLLQQPEARVSIGKDRSVALDANGALQLFGELWPKDSFNLKLSETSSACFGGLEIEWRFLEAARNLEKQSGAMVFDADRVGEAVILRHWQQGDEIRLSGRASARPLNEMFSRNKIPRAQRHRAVVATTATGEIFWVEGLRITEEFKVTASTRRFLEWRWRRR